MTTPTPALTAESEAVVAFYEREDGLTPYQKALLVELLSAAERAVYEQGVGDGIAMEQGMQADAVARHVRDTGCEGLRDLLDRMALYLSESVAAPFWPAGTKDAFREFLALPESKSTDYMFAKRNIAALASPATEEYPDEGDPGPFAEGIVTAPEAERRGGEG